MTVDTSERAAALPLAERAGMAWRRLRRPFQRVPLGVLLGGLLGGLFLVTGGGLVYGLYGANAFGSAQIRDKSELFVQAVVLRTRQHLQPAERLVSRLAAMAGSGALDPADGERFAAAAGLAMVGLPQVRALAFVDANDRVLRVQRGEGGDIAGPVKRANWADDPRVRADLERAQRSTAPFWDDFFYAESSGSTLLNLRAPVRRNGAFAGMLVAVVSILDLARFVAELGEDHWENAFILVGHDKVLAHSRWRPPTGILNDAKPLPDLGDLGDPVLAAMWGAERTISASIVGNGLLHGHLARVDGADYAFLYAKIADFGDEPWLAGFYLRLDDLRGPFAQFWPVTAAAALLFAGLAVGAALAVARLTRSLRLLGVAAGRIRSLDFDGKPLPPSAIRELDTAARAFNTMVAGLRAYRPYLPDSLVRRLVSHEPETLAPVQREVTVLFTDIARFTAYAEEQEPAAVAALLNEHFTLLAQCIAAEHGTIDKYLGDGLMAFWGAPDAQPDHAERAFHAALAIASAVRAHNRRRSAAGLPVLEVTIGLSSGPAMAGNIGAPGRLNYTLIGDTVNTAHRIERLAKQQHIPTSEATILVSESTARMLDDGLAPFAVGSYVLRGRGEPIKVFRIS